MILRLSLDCSDGRKLIDNYQVRFVFGWVVSAVCCQSERPLIYLFHFLSLYKRLGKKVNCG